MREKMVILVALWLTGTLCARCVGQRIQFPQATNGMRPLNEGSAPTLPSTGQPAMVPINPSTQSGIYPSGGTGGTTFDPYAASSGAPPVLGPPVLPPSTVPNPYGNPYSGQALPPGAPGMGSYPNTAPYGAGGTYPNGAPSSVYPNPYANGYPNNNVFQDMYNSVFGAPPQSVYPPPNGTMPPPNGGYYNQWNPSGTMFTGPAQSPDFVRLCQGARYRQSFILGNDDTDALRIFDSDISVAFVWPNFCFSTQPLYILPSFSLHQWAGPMPPSTADLPPLAYSAFLDAGWQSDQTRIFGGELGLRFGMFSDFNTSTSDSLRLMGRAIARLRCTPKTTLKGGVIYLDRVKTKLLPAFGVVWLPNPNTRLDLFFPEPKLASYLTTHGNMDTWWYAGGYYGGGSWTIQREAGGKDSIDINDLRIVLGLEFGKNEEMRNGRRMGFIEIGYVFDRELIYKNSPLDDMGLQDTIMFRGGIGY